MSLPRHRDQSTSAARFIAGESGFLTLTQCFDLTDGLGVSTQDQAAPNQIAAQISPVSQAVIASPVVSAHRLRISFSRNRLREVATPGIGIDVVRQVSELPLLLGVLISDPD